MPEGPEVRLGSDFINFIGTKVKILGIQRMPHSKREDISFHVRDPAFDINALNISAQWRGKELMITLSNDIFSRSFVFSLGLTGLFLWCDSATFLNEKIIVNNTAVRFICDDGTFICFVDRLRYGNWRISESWNKERGPDPFLEPEEFKDNVIFNFMKSSIFKKPIYEALLYQKYFNGIGLYLVAKILYDVDENPFVAAEDYIKAHGEKLFQSIFKIINESYDLQKQNKSINDDWYYPYQQGKKIIMSNGRKFWYDSKWDKYNGI